MARALVVFESMFGNTKAVAEAVGAGLADRGPVDVVEVGAAPDAVPGDVDLLVVGAPTHAFSLSRASTRKSAADQATGGLVSRGRGVREWLDALAPVDRAVGVIAFDTKVKVGWLPGSAAKTAVKRLRRLRFTEVGPPMSFYVGGTPGPLLDGEVDRATAWARTIRATSRR